MCLWMVRRQTVSNRSCTGELINWTIRRVVDSASNRLRVLGSRISRRFLRTSVPGYRYGSVLSVMQRLDLRSHLFERQLAVNVAPVDGVLFIARFKSFQSDRSQSLSHGVEAFGPLLAGNFESKRHRIYSI